MFRWIFQHPAEFELIRSIQNARRFHIDLSAGAQYADIP